MQKILTLVTALLILIPTFGFIYATTFKSTPHTHDTITALDSNWQVTLSPLFEHSTFLNQDNQTITAFPLKSNQTMAYGFVLPASANFNITYAITAVQQPSTRNNKQVSIKPHNKACVFIVTATSPAKPDVKPVSFNGATCDWGINQQGEYYKVG